jgi:hypothetical protein
MADEKSPNITFEVRVTPGCAGVDPNAPDWEVLELEDGVVRNDASVFDNLTQAEAEDMAAMWSKKRDEAELKAQEEAGA